MTGRSLIQANQAATPDAASVGVMQRKCACGTHSRGAEKCPACSAQGSQRNPTGNLRIGAPNDRFEREADDVADQVTRPEGPVRGGTGSVLQSHASLQRKISRLGGGSTRHSPVPAVLGGRGRALDRATRDFMEPRFGHDFSGVRAHTGAEAAGLARSVQARAFTLGQDIVFGGGEYAPGTHAGQRLLAHELTHTIQQGERGGQLQRLVEVNPSSTAANDILGQFNSLCPGGNFSVDANRRIQSNCTESSPLCDCLCDVVTDTATPYTIEVHNVTNNPERKTLHDGTTETVPTPSEGPRTEQSGSAPTVHMPSTTGSELAFGAFRPDGSPFIYGNPRILVHELCSHARLGHSYSGSYGDRPGHDITINTENALCGAPARGLYSSRRQGESFFQLPASDAKKVFKLRDGWHHEHVP